MYIEFWCCCCCCFYFSLPQVNARTCVCVCVSVHSFSATQDHMRTFSQNEYIAYCCCISLLPGRYALSVQRKLCFCYSLIFRQFFSLLCALPLLFFLSLSFFFPPLYCLSSLWYTLSAVLCFAPLAIEFRHRIVVVAVLVIVASNLLYFFFSFHSIRECRSPASFYAASFVLTMTQPAQAFRHTQRVTVTGILTGV